MEEKKIEKDPEIVKKKVYTSPVLTLYGKLIELTAGGSGKLGEVSGLPKPQRP